ncbi:MAG: glycoside hydrolase family 127 protein [Clostridia bacterium]|nr:glycoside hydrolase family 127 protein [Clostridia bacterium]
MAAFEFYAPGTVHYKRLGTDRQFIIEGLRAKFTGYAHDAYRFAAEEQCMDPARWARFADQFRLRTDGTDGGWRGEYWGKAMRGAAFIYSCSRDTELYKILCGSVEDVLSAADETGVIASYPPESDFGGWDIWCRKYVLLGLQYFTEICEDESLKKRCVEAMERQARSLMRAFGPGKRNLTEVTPIWRGLAAASVLEPVVRLYDLTDKKEYLDFASYIVSLGGTSVADVYEIAFEGRTPPCRFPMTKAYELISNFEGLLEYYRATGDEKYKTAVLHFAELAAENEITLIGSAGCTHELFDGGRYRQTDKTCTEVMQETCVTVTWMKLCLQMLCLTGAPRWADRFEQSFYNAYLGSLNTEHRIDKSVLFRHPDTLKAPLPFISYAPLLPDVRGRSVGGLCVMSDNRYYGCCAAIGGAGIGMLHKAAVTYCEDGVAVNLFIPGAVELPLQNGVNLRLETETGYPAGDTVKIRVFPEKETAFSLRVRIPEWSENVSLTLNGENVPAAAGGYAEARRIWKKGDTVTLTLDLRAKVIRPEKWETLFTVSQYDWKHHYMVPRALIAPEDIADYAALRRGPLVLGRDARLGEDPRAPVDILTDEAGFAVAEPADAPYPHMIALRVKQKDGGYFTVTDYAATGKTMDEESLCGCWWPTKSRG